MNHNKQTMLFLSRKTAYSTSFAAGGLDILLTAAAFDQDVTLVFSGDGVYNLLKDQDSNAIGLKNSSKILSALELYEVKKILVEQSALQARSLSQADLLIPVKMITSQNLSLLLEETDQVFNF